VYLIGVYSSIYKTQINTYINNNKRFLGLTVIALGLIQVLVFQQSGNFHKNFWELDVIDVNLLQKIIFGYLIMAILNMYEKRNINTLKILAETSFPIYFIHPFIINIFNKIVSLCRITYEGNLLIFALISLMVILVSMATAYLIKQIFQKNSRYLIGW
jgi:peptidoglycan/LPS O-acetylase OafA/YrhL